MCWKTPAVVPSLEILLSFLLFCFVLHTGLRVFSPAHLFYTTISHFSQISTVTTEGACFALALTMGVLLWLVVTLALTGTAPVPLKNAGTGQFSVHVRHRGSWRLLNSERNQRRSDSKPSPARRSRGCGAGAAQGLRREPAGSTGAQRRPSLQAPPGRTQCCGRRGTREAGAAQGAVRAGPPTEGRALSRTHRVRGGLAGSCSAGTKRAGGGSQVSVRDPGRPGPHPPRGTGAGPLRPRPGGTRLPPGGRGWSRARARLPGPAPRPLRRAPRSRTDSRAGFASLAPALFVQLRLS